MRDAEKSIAAMKQIYETHYGYRDLAERAERPYECIGERLRDNGSHLDEISTSRTA